MQLEYLDFNSKEYKSLSDEEKSLIKKAKATGQIKNIMNCKNHGLQIATFVKCYGEGGETNYFGCPICLELQQLKVFSPSKHRFERGDGAF